MCVGVFRIRSLEFTFLIGLHLFKLVVEVQSLLREVVIVVCDALSDLSNLAFANLHQLLNVINLAFTLGHLVDEVLVTFECQVDHAH